MIQKAIGRKKSTDGSLDEFLQDQRLLGSWNAFRRKEAYAVAAERLKGNKFADLLVKIKNVKELERRIIEKMDVDDYRRGFLLEVFRYVKEFYTDKKTGKPMLRKDGESPRASHPLSVAYAAVLLGCDFQTVLLALFHDLLEDSKNPKYGTNEAETLAKITKLAGKHIVDDVLLLSHSDSQSHEDYLRGIYNSKSIRLMVVKGLDMLENLKTLYFDPKKSPGAIADYQQLLENTLDKALNHAGIWKKLNRDFYLLLFTLINDNVPLVQNMLNTTKDELSFAQFHAEEAKETYGRHYLPHLKEQQKEAEAKRNSLEWKFSRLLSIEAKFDKLKTESIRQLDLEERHYAILTVRGEADLSLIRTLPDSQTQVITLYLPGLLQHDNMSAMHFFRVLIPEEHMEIEFPGDAGIKQDFQKLLNKYFPGMSFEKTESLMPKRLVCTSLYRMEMPYLDHYSAFLFHFQTMADDAFRN